MGIGSDPEVPGRVDPNSSGSSGNLASHFGTKNRETMKNIIRLFFLGISLIIISCGQRDPNKQIDEGKVEGETYTSQEIGWTIQIPKGWSVISKDKIEVNKEKGLKAIEEVAGKVDYTGLKHLISFQKNQFNVFQSTSEPFKLKYEGEWKENNEKLNAVIHAAYINQGIKVDTSSTKAIIDGLDFEVFKTVLYGPDGKVILFQELYSRHINGYDFGVNINYNNDQNKEKMMEVWKNSKFKK